MSTSRLIVQDLLSHAGVAIDGPAKWDISVIDERVFDRVLAQGSLGLGDAYVDGWWECQAVDEFVCRILKAKLEDHIRWNVRSVAGHILARFYNYQSPKRAFQVGEAHYDLGNDLYRAMLDKRMVYSCGYWETARNLDEAQEAKLDLVCRKLDLRPGMRVLDVGCGWGGFAIFAAERFGVEVVGVTVSREQVDLGRRLALGRPVTIHLEDYRRIEGRFDRIASMGMLEHVGPRNYRAFMSKMASLLSEDGLLLVHSITNNTTITASDPWIVKHIFPNGKTPSLTEISSAAEPYFVIEDIHNIGPHYEPTLQAWYKNFQTAWPRLRGRLGDRFKRMWDYYLLISIGTFRSRSSQVLQVLMSRPGRLQPISRRAQ